MIKIHKIKKLKSDSTQKLIYRAWLRFYFIMPAFILYGIACCHSLPRLFRGSVQGSVFIATLKTWQLVPDLFRYRTLV